MCVYEVVLRLNVIYESSLYAKLFISLHYKDIGVLFRFIRIDLFRYHVVLLLCKYHVVHKHCM